jgi:hypothetical protein
MAAVRADADAALFAASGTALAVLVMGSLALAVSITKLQANRAVRLRMGFQKVGLPPAYRRAEAET